MSLIVRSVRWSSTEETLLRRRKLGKMTLLPELKCLKRRRRAGVGNKQDIRKQIDTKKTDGNKESETRKRKAGKTKYAKKAQNKLALRRCPPH